ncbi:NAD(P)-binding protein [Choiromyces venosus 120613-1]|uniref:NAD(P)-binding protein n=1 Tax=Choiromyces venosus 120613-1 TaxID=1336337 RepID=A0A3N4JCG1_9PEZI|nr:NAD(P)-binding protein [Choiromyces venosus 120613-1]
MPRRRGSLLPREVLEFTTKGRLLAAGHEIWIKKLKFFATLAVLVKVNDLLSWGAHNNWTRAKFNPKEEFGGIGGAIVRDFAEKGVKVIVLDIQEMTYETPSNVHYYKVDLRSISAVKEIAKRIPSEIGDPTVLINNAGVCGGKTILDATEVDIRLTFDVNTFAQLWLVKELLPSMIAKNHGHVVTVASVAGFTEAPQMVNYAASKAASIAFHEGVRTTLITQGFVKTALFAGFKNHSTFLLPGFQPESVAEAIVDQVLSGNAGHVVMPKTYVLLSGAGLLGRTSDIMEKWHGKQVIDPVEKQN